MSPFNFSRYFRHIVSPIPVPLGFNPFESEIIPKRLNSFDLCSSFMPTPVSSTENITDCFPHISSEDNFKMIDPVKVNLTALEIKLSRTCLSLPLSDHMSAPINCLSMSRFIRSPFCSHCVLNMSYTSSMSPLILK